LVNKEASTKRRETANVEELPIVKDGKIQNNLYLVQIKSVMYLTAK